MKPSNLLPPHWAQCNLSCAQASPEWIPGAADITLQIAFCKKTPGVHSVAGSPPWAVASWRTLDSEGNPDTSNLGPDSNPGSASSSLADLKQAV